MNSWVFFFCCVSICFAGCGGQESIKLLLPKEAPDSLLSADSLSRAPHLVVLLSGDSDIYAYGGADIRLGKKYSYPELKDSLGVRRKDNAFVVLIKVAGNGTYKNTVGMLDLVTVVGIKHYALVDIGKGEEEYLREIYR